MEVALENALMYLDGLDKLSTINQRKAVSEFMRVIRGIYLMFGGSEIPHKPFTPIALEFIGKYVKDLELFLQNIFEGYDEWETVCWQRTSIEVFNTFFGDSHYLDTLEVDDLIEERGKYESVRDEIIPENIPDSHWWWKGERYGG